MGGSGCEVRVGYRQVGVTAVGVDARMDASEAFGSLSCWCFGGGLG
jgi:hypothetical protein